MISSPWTQDDAVIARAFFSTDTWAKMIEILKVTGPQITTKSLDQLAFSGLAKDTWEKCLNAFTNFAQDVVQEEDFEQVDFSTLDSHRRFDGAQPEVAKVASETVPQHGRPQKN